MKIKIRRKDLVERSACSTGLEWFDSFASRLGQGPDIVIEWDALSMLWALSNHDCKDLVRWAIDKGLLSTWSLSGANLRYADLSDADLRRANLYEADLSGAYYPEGHVPDGWRRTETGHLTEA